MKLHDEIYEWCATLPDWQQELFLRAAPGRPLADQSLDEVLDLFLGRPTAPTARKVSRQDLPADLAGDARVELIAIEHRRGVNRLAAGETLKFIASGLNVIFGHNGSGKSGWARIPKHAGRARQPEEILGDVYADAGVRPRPEAVIDWRLDGDARRLELALDAPAPGDLANLCVFDAASGQRYLTDDHEVDYVPLALETIQRLARAQVALAERLDARAAELLDPELELDVYPRDTTVRTLLSQLSAETDVDELRRLGTLTETDFQRRDELAREVAEIDGDNSGRLAATAERDAQQGAAMAQALRDVAARTGEDAFAEAREGLAGVAAAAAVARGMSAEQFVGEPLSGIATEPWLVMWKAAERFMTEIHGQGMPPDHDPERCPLCLRVLEPEARDRFRRMGAWVRSDVEEQLATAQERLRARREALPDLTRLRETHSAVLATIAEHDAQLAEAIERWLQGAATVIAAIRDGELDEVAPAPADPGTRVDGWAAGRRAAAERHRGLQDTATEARLRGELAELRAREALSERLDSIVRRVERLRERARLDARRGELRTNAISTRLRTFADGFVTEDLQAALREQLAALNFEDIELIACRTSGRGGTPRVGLKIRAKGNVPLRNVLSEGEQRRLALAFFLAEISVAYPGCAVVLDDPVCSVDHQGRRHIAATLVRAAADRQVIVFTHELTFLHELQRAAARARVPLHEQFVLRRAGRAGLVQDELPWQGMTAEKRLRSLTKDLQDIRALHRRDPDGNDYAKRASTFCGNMRQAFERALEDEVLGGVVTRGDTGVHPNRMRLVAWSEEICHLSDSGMDDSSPWVHDGARAANAAPPTPDELAEGVDVLRRLLKACKDLVAQRKQEEHAAQPVAGEVLREPPAEVGDVHQLPGIAGAA